MPPGDGAREKLGVLPVPHGSPAPSANADSSVTTLRA